MHFLKQEMQFNRGRKTKNAYDAFLFFGTIVKRPSNANLK